MSEPAYDLAFDCSAGPGAEPALVVVPASDLPTVATVIADECARIDAASDAHDAADLQFDFEATPAVLVSGSTVSAGVRALQMGAINITDWQGQQARALAAVLDGNPTSVIKVIVSDNATVLAPAEQFLRCFEAGCQRKEANAVWRVQRKALVRAQTTAAGVAATRATTDAGWP